ncbi:MAG TPA: DUF1614 domain-containing protein [Thermomicrobiaceae bacterium]|nr:DUF1614 domain-containing protein [Thermomicrobiaceae bacterium]
MQPPTGRHPLWTPLLLLLIALPIAAVLIYFDVARSVFQRLGLSPGGAALVVGASLVGSVINVPLTRRRIVLADPRAEQLPSMLQWLLPIVHYYPPQVAEEVLALNVGGAVVPIVFSTYLCTLATTPLGAALIATLVVAAVAKLFAHPEPGVGITLPAFVPPLVAALAAHLLVAWMGGAAGSAAPVAYISGTIGTLVGADLLNLPRVLRGALLQQPVLGPATGAATQAGPPARRVMVSIGGAGMFDGIFLAGILAPLLA